MDEANTLLTTVSTAWYGLIDRANLKKGIKYSTLVIDNVSEKCL